VSSKGKTVRLVVLMVEVEQPEGISARKLLLETARHNVITAYSQEGALDLLRRFPNVDLAVLHTELEDAAFEKTVRQIKMMRPDLAIVGISPVPDRRVTGVDYMVSSYDPQLLLQLLSERFEAAKSDDD
jgi:two-component SAPR family response regulator